MRMTNALRFSHAKQTLYHFSLGLILMEASACAIFSNGRLIYDQGSARIGIEADPTVARDKEEVRNAHPAHLTAEAVQSLFKVIQVSGWSGSLVGMFVEPRPVPLLAEEELQKYSGPLADALHLVGPTERVFFSFPKPGKAYSEDRTTGAIFFRGRYAHLVVNDHSSVLHADTGGGEEKDIRDTKGLKLWVARPAQAATVPDLEEPRWAPFETVHISLNVREVLALRSAAPPVRLDRDSVSPSPMSAETGLSGQDLQNQVRELTNSNLELRHRLDEQTKRMRDLTEELNRLRLDLEQSKPGKESPRKRPSP